MKNKLEIPLKYRNLYYNAVLSEVIKLYKEVNPTDIKLEVPPQYRGNYVIELRNVMKKLEEKRKEVKDGNIE